MIFVITEIICIPIGTGTALRKNRSIRVLVQYSILYRLYHAPDFGSDPPIESDRDPGVTV